MIRRILTSSLAVVMALAACNDDVITPATTTDTVDTGQADGGDATTTSATDTGTTSTGTGTTATDATAPSDTSSDTALVTFALTVPPETPIAGTVAIVGSDAALGGAGLALTGDGNGHYSGSARLAKGAQTWHAALGGDVELTDDGSPVTHDLTVSGDATQTVEVRRWGAASGVTQPGLAIIVTVPAGTDSTSGIFVAGNQDAFGGQWNPAGLQLAAAQGGRFAATVGFAMDTAIEMKVTRGSWETVEKGPGGEEISNRTWTVAAAYGRWEITVARWRDDTSEPPVGDADIEILPNVSSSYLTPDRDIRVWLPPGYDTDTTRTYPVLYMHDGQNLFDGATSAFGTEWSVDETAQALVTSGEIEPLIIVGVDNTDDRMSEYTESYDDSEQTGGDADNYGKFLALELKPLIDSTYRTKPDATDTGVCGSSLGGLVSMYFGLTLSSTFQRIGVVSPSVWWDNRDIIDRVDGLSGKLPLRIWIDIGKDEGSGGETVQDAADLAAALEGKGWVDGQDLKFTEYTAPGVSSHDEASWADRMDDILRWLYPAP